MGGLVSCAGMGDGVWAYEAIIFTQVADRMVARMEDRGSVIEVVARMTAVLIGVSVPYRRETDVEGDISIVYDED